MFISGKVKQLNTFKGGKRGSGIVLIAATVEASQALSKQYQAWCVVKDDGTVESAHCTCMAGINELWVPEEPDDGQQDDTRSVQTWLQASAASCTGVTTAPSASQRLGALFSKRLHYWTRSPFAIFLGWILTVAIFFLLCKRWKVPGAPSADLGLGVRIDLESSAHFGGARCFLQAERESDFTRYLEKLAELEGATMTRMGDAKQELVAFARRDFVKYYSHYAYGVVDNGSRRAESRDTNQKYVQQVLTILGQLFPVTKPDASLGLLRRAEEYGALRRSGVRYLRRSSVRQLGCAVDRARAP
ncbi:hypothetical protein V5799_024728 [Amblyomma americanum]|uniref:Uncharacterized protein n=2 Tax=Amblyomma americanum TaxID=6943 RepID=A0AAQ4EBQ8_AMBAM